jgi:hypothetical protein
VSQDVVMLNDTLAANVSLGTEVDEGRVLAALQSANLGDLVAKLPQGIHATVGHNAAELSGGQRQRLAIARAIYKDAPVLILDEATSALDNESERLVQEALQRLMAGRTTLVIAHRLSTPSCWPSTACTPGCTTSLRARRPKSKKQIAEKPTPSSAGASKSLKIQAQCPQRRSTPWFTATRCRTALASWRCRFAAKWVCQ